MSCPKFVTLVVACIASSAATVGAAPDRASVVVQGVQSFYRKTPHLTAKFRHVNHNSTFGKRTENGGRVYLKKPGKMRWDYVSKRNKREVTRTQLSDGTMIWAIDVPGKWYFKQKLAESTLPVAVSFLTGKGDLAKEFDARLLTGTSHGGRGEEVVELTPKKPSAQFKTLVLVVDPSSFRVKKSIVTTATGDMDELSFFEPETTKTVSDALFVFNPRAAKGFRQLSPP